MRDSPHNHFGPHLWKVDPETECWLWQRAHARYGHYLAPSPHGRKLVLAHRRAYEVFKGPVAEGLCVLHRCDVPRCVNPDHLFLGTRSDNAKDRERKGRGGIIKLVAADAERIRDLAAFGISRKVLSERFGVTTQHIGEIVKRAQW